MPSTVKPMTPARPRGRPRNLDARAAILAAARELMNEAGQLVLAYQVYRCWVSEYQAIPQLDANGAGVAIEHLRIENEGWERDTSVVEPAEPSGP